MQALGELGYRAVEAGRYNIAFTCFYLTHRLEGCLDVLLQSKRYAEAAMFCRSYLPAKINDVVAQWQVNLSEDKPDVAATLTCPGSNPELWPLQAQALEIQKSIEAQNFENSSIGAGQYINLKGMYQRDIFAGEKAGFEVEENRQESTKPPVNASASPPAVVEEEEEEVLAAEEDEPDMVDVGEDLLDEPEEVQAEPEVEIEAEEEEAEATIEEVDEDEDIFGDDEFGVDDGDDDQADINTDEIDEEDLNLDDFGDFD